MKGTTTVDTIDELVAIAVWDSTRRYTLKDDTNYVWDDPVAGKAWVEGEDAFCGNWKRCGEDGYDEYKQNHDTYLKMRPNQHPVTTCSLRQNYTTFYTFSEELGNQIYAVWTKKHSYGADVPTGTMTIPGILKRLGRTDVSEKIKDAETKRKEAEAIRNRNYLRAALNRKLADIEEFVTRNGAEIGVTVEMFQLPVELADKLNEEKA